MKKNVFNIANITDLRQLESLLENLRAFFIVYDFIWSNKIGREYQICWREKNILVKTTRLHLASVVFIIIKIDHFNIVAI